MKKCVVAIFLALMLLFTAACAETMDMDLPYCGLTLQVEEQLLNDGLAAYWNTDEVDGNTRIFAILYFLDNGVYERLAGEAQAAIDAQDNDKLNALSEELNQHNFDLAGFYLVPKQEYDAAIADGKTVESLVSFSEAPETVQVLGENEGYVYLVFRMPKADEAKLANCDADEIAKLEKCYAALDDILASAQMGVILEETAIQLPKTMPSFTTKDINGNEVTNDIFAQKDLTVVNVWGTFCGPCISEMPELGEWSAQLPENVQLIGLVCDVNSYDDQEQVQAALDIVKETGANFTHLVAGSDFDELMTSITAVPTTFFVDKEGNIVGEPVIGANVQGYKDFVDAYLK